MKKILEIIWPRLEGEPSGYQDFLPEGFEVDDDKLDDAVGLSQQMYQYQKERVSTIEAKSVVYVGFFGAVIAVLAFVIKDILMVQNKTEIHNVALLSGGMISIYILQIMRFSIKAMERKAYFVLDESDFLNKDRNMISVNIINKTKRNYDVINEKVDCMAMAQEFTKRLIWILSIISSALISYAVYDVVNIKSIFASFSSFFSFDFSIYDLILFFLFIGGLINYFKIRKIQKEMSSN